MIFNSIWTFVYYRIIKKIDYAKFPLEIPFVGMLKAESDKIVIIDPERSMKEKKEIIEMKSLSSRNLMREPNSEEYMETADLLMRLNTLETKVDTKLDKVENDLKKVKVHIGFTEWFKIINLPVIYFVLAMINT